MYDGATLNRILMTGHKICQLENGLRYADECDFDYYKKKVAFFLTYHAYLNFIG